MSDALRIIYLQAENVKRLRAVRIKPDKTLVRIEGRNAQGKTSVLDAIAAALGGGKWQPDKPVREGERKASVSVDLGELVVERRWTASGNSTLEVTSKGTKLASPQAILDKLVGDLTFDPLAFVHMKPKDQADLLKKLAGLDFSALDRERESAFNERTVVNRDLKAAEARVGSVPPKPKQETPVFLADLLKQQQEAIRTNAKIDELGRSIQTAAANVKQSEVGITKKRSDSESTIARLRKELDQRVDDIGKELEEFIRSEKGNIARANESIKSLEGQLAGLNPVDATVFATQIQEAESINKSIDDRSTYEQRKALADEKLAQAEWLTNRIQEIDDEKARKLCQAKFPLDGLSVGPEGPTLNGIPFSQASSAEQLRTSVAIGLSQKPRCRIMLCRDGSLLDNAGMESLHKIAVEFDAQCFVERVSDTKSPSAVYIEDGEVVDNE